MKRTHLVTIKGNSSSWNIRTEITREDAQDLRDDGLEVMESYYIIPEWMFEYKYLPKVWMFLQDLFYLRNPFTK